MEEFTLPPVFLLLRDSRETLISSQPIFFFSFSNGVQIGSDWNTVLSAVLCSGCCGSVGAERSAQAGSSLAALRVSNLRSHHGSLVHEALFTFTEKKLVSWLHLEISRGALLCWVIFVNLSWLLLSLCFLTRVLPGLIRFGEDFCLFCPSVCWRAKQEYRLCL